MQFKTATLDGKKIIYGDTTRFEVQVGRGNSAYKTRYAFEGNLHQAVRYYLCINIGNGYKKRLLMPGARKPVLARQFS
jgi:hypothetical protein